MVHIDKSAEIHSSEEESRKLEIVLEKSEGTGETVSQDTEVRNLRESYYDYIGHEPKLVDFDKVLRPESPLRATIQRRVGGREEILTLIKAYEELFLAKKRVSLSNEFDDLDECTLKGSPYKGRYYTTVKEVESGDAFVEFLVHIEKRLAAEEEVREKEIKDAKEVKGLRAEIEEEEKKRQIEVFGIFSQAEITIKGIKEEKSIPLAHYGEKLGAKLLPDYYDQMSDEERADAEKAKDRFRKRLIETLPVEKDRKLLYEKLAEQEHLIEKELIKLYKERLFHESTKEIEDQIEKKTAERDKASALLRAVASTF